MYASFGVRTGPWVLTQSMLIFCVLILGLGLLLTNPGLESLGIHAGGVPQYVYKRVFNDCSKRLFFSGGKSWYWGGNSNGSAIDPSSGHTFAYKTAVAFQPKDRDDQIYQKLKDSLQSPTGEDNYFVQANAMDDLFAGVADGVGGWAEHGYDSSAISRELCKALQEFTAISVKPLTPKQVLDNAYSKIKAENIVKVGGTTATVAHLKSNGSLEVANLGDSWCAVFRDAKLVFETKAQTLGFNTPYQLAIIPDEIQEAAAKNGNRYIQNVPTDADEYSFQLEKDDVVILATDGVTDNIAISDIEIFLRDNKAKIDSDIHGVTQDLVRNVVKISKDSEFPSVFAQEISKMTGKLYKGGKEDDITMVMIKVD
ncbi:Uncharacterized protein RNJ44_02658 [Nakaseomyces bracarensis]|uniref:Protein phosphatase n=1 Tax=Nakaseomyces bracarensis TaxID=273131 RepID=A0ABR4NZY3_9SACH